MKKTLFFLILFAPSFLHAQSRPGFIGDDVWDETQSILSVNHSINESNATNLSFNNGLLLSTASQDNNQYTTNVRYASKRVSNFFYRVGYTTSDIEGSGYSFGFSDVQLGLNYEIGQNTFALDYGKNLSGDNYNDRLSILYSYETGDLTAFTGVNVIRGLQGSQERLNFHRVIGLRYDYRSEYSDKFFTFQVSNEGQSTTSNRYVNGVARYLFKENKPYIVGIEGAFHKALNGQRTESYNIGTIFAVGLGKGQVVFTPALNITTAYDAPTYKVLGSDYVSYKIDYNLELKNDVFLNASIQLNDQSQEVRYTQINSHTLTEIDNKIITVTLTKLLD